VNETFSTGGAILTVDLGNSSGSAALVSAPADRPRELVELGAWRAAGDESEALAAAIHLASTRVPALAVAALSAVGSHARERAVVECLRASGLRVAVLPDAGLELRIDHPETCGSDRKYAARGALEIVRQGALDPAAGVIIVDAGTALTVDAARPAPAGSAPGDAGVFLGGAIALGPDSLASSLAAAGARLPAFDLRPGAPALGRSTEHALRAGVVVGFRGAVRELCREIAVEAHGSLDATAAFLTGGARDYARDAVVELFGSRVIEDPLLVHRGLAAAMGERLG